MLPNWIEKLIYGLLMICVGGVGSLTYFDAFVPGHAHPYHLSILEIHPHNHNPLPPPPGAVAELIQQQPLSRLTTQPILMVSQTTVPALTHFFQSGLHNGYLLTEGQITIVSNASFSDRVPVDTLPGRSALLLPPDKPPTLVTDNPPPS